LVETKVKIINPKSKYDGLIGKTIGGVIKVGGKKLIIVTSPKIKNSDNMEVFNLDDLEILEEGRSKYYDFKTDETLSPRQKVGHSLRIVRKSLSEAEKLIDMNLRLKKEAGLQSKDYWKRTHDALTKIDERLVRLIGKVKNFRD
jgi:hypothetical protein